MIAKRTVLDLTDQELRNQIDNHERRGATLTPLYRELVEERARRFGKGLKAEASLEHLMEAAKAQRFTTYGALAEASGVPWQKARRRMDGPVGHLNHLLTICHARGLPLLTALCVNQEGVNDGSLSQIALTGFIKDAQRLGYAIADVKKFLRECQARCFAWGKGAAAVCSDAAP
jgi:hypothetical protein